MDKIRKKYGDDNCVSSLVQACYPTGFTVMDFETLNAIGGDWIDKELFVKLLSHDLSVELFTQEDKDKIKELLYKIHPGEEIPPFDINVHPHRVMVANMIIGKLPRGFKDGGASIFSGFSGLGKTTVCVQIAGNVYHQYKKYTRKDGSPMVDIHYYMTEKNALDKPRFMSLARMSEDEYASSVKVCGGVDNSTSDLVSYVQRLRDEKMASQLDLVVDSMCVDGKPRKAMAPSILVVDSLSMIRVAKYADKMEKEFEKGKDGNKESDMMRRLQAIATMLNTTNLFKYCEEANIILLFVAHIGQDQGITIGYQQIQVRTGLNNKAAHKTKGVPGSITYLMDGIFDLSGMEANMQELNEMYNRPNDDLRFISKMMVGKNRGGEVFKGKMIPLMFTKDGLFDNTMSAFYYYHKELGEFDFTKGQIEGIYKDYSNGAIPREGSEMLKFTKGKVIDNMLFNNPLSVMIFTNNLFRDYYMYKVYKDDKIKEREVVNNIMTGGSNVFSSLFNSFNLNFDEAPVKDSTAEEPKVEAA